MSFLFAGYQFFCAALFLFISAILLYHLLLIRWVKFSIGFFVLYSVSCYFFFGKTPDFVNAQVLQGTLVFMFFFGSLACVGYCLIRQLTFRQTIGFLASYLVGLIGLAYLAGGIGTLQGEAVRDFVIAAPYVVFYVFSPLVFGYCLYRGLGLRESFGLYLMFVCVLVILVAGTATYFEVPFGVGFELSKLTKFMIQVTSALAVVIGVVVIVAHKFSRKCEYGYCREHRHTIGEVFARVVVFLCFMAVIGLFIQLTLGYDELGEVAGLFLAASD